MSASFKQQLKARQLGQQLQPKIINVNNCLMGSPTEISERLLSNEFPLEDDNFMDAQMSIPDEYQEESFEDEDQISDGSSGYYHMNKYQNQNMIDQKFQEFLQHAQLQHNYDYSTSSLPQSQLTMNNQYQQQKINYRNNNNYIKDYVSDKQKQLQEMYQANEIIYEEEDSPEGLSTTNSALSRQAPTLSNEQVSQFNKENLAIKERLITQIGDMFQKQYKTDRNKIRDKITDLQQQISFKQTYLQSLMTQNSEQLKINKSESSTIVVQTLGESKKHHHNHSRSFNSQLSSGSFNSNNNSQKKITKQGSITKKTANKSCEKRKQTIDLSGLSKQQPQAAGINHTMLLQFCKNMKQDRQKNKKLFNSDIISNIQGTLSPQLNKHAIKKTMLLENKENNSKSRQKNLLMNSKSTDNKRVKLDNLMQTNQGIVQAQMKETKPTLHKKKMSLNQVSPSLFSIKKQNHKLRII